MLDERLGSEAFGNGAIDGAAVGPITQVYMDKDFARHPASPAACQIQSHGTMTFMQDVRKFLPLIM